jgi:hypothetical protein
MAIWVTGNPSAVVSPKHDWHSGRSKSSQKRDIRAALELAAALEKE